ncbi:transcriptional regulator [Azospirillum palustre]|uniref:Transcriptional regulator n=1 Tax=Azospirillum palustre TaxID=2044885 RepID=A0A2B8BFM7_9PROT|nr:helix-turn-helix transcriptional regulator [Azospirillum palustre]PGH56509.1 transcriptional regulator [Azospirillum palustre]
MLTAPQVRAARALLGWSQTELSTASGISVPTIKRMEGAIGPGRSAADNVQAIRAALEAAGVIFIDDDDEGPGVRLKKVSL